MSRGKDKKFYVYAIMDGAACVYVGKGCGYRSKQSAKRHKGVDKILGWYDTDDKAFEAERIFIDQLKPVNNKSPGGNGGRSKPKELTPEQKRAEKEWNKFIKEYQQVGPRKYVARFLLSRVNERNCADLGLSKVDISRWREVADGLGA